MANLTVSIDEKTLKRARIRALQEDTSVNGLVSEFLNRYARTEVEPSLAVRELLESIAESDWHGGYSGRTWSRDDLHER